MKKGDVILLESINSDYSLISDEEFVGLMYKVTYVGVWTATLRPLFHCIDPKCDEANCLRVRINKVIYTLVQGGGS